MPDPTRPRWCPHADCQPLIGFSDAVCGGRLPAPSPHAGDTNTHRLCMRAGDVFDFQVNKSDCFLLGLVVERLRADGPSAA